MTHPPDLPTNELTKRLKHSCASVEPVKAKTAKAIAFPTDGYCTYAQVQARLQISNSTMHLWIQQNRLPAPVRIGARAMRFSVQDILEYERAAREATKVAAE